MTVPIDTLYQTNVVVKDAKASARQYAEFYGITKWNVARLTGDRLRNRILYGQSAAITSVAIDPLTGGDQVEPLSGDFEYLTATGTNLSQGLTFQLIEPLSGHSTFSDFLARRGDGIHSIWLTMLEPEKLPDLKQWLASEGIVVGQSATLDDVLDVYYFDTRAALGGFYLQVNVPRKPTWEHLIATDELWDFVREVSRPASVEFVTSTPGINHFGVVVNDVDARLAMYARLFGAARWRGYDWHTGPDSLEETTNHGQAVEHGFRTGRANVGGDRFGKGFGFEVIEPKFGPCTFKDDFLDLYGPGIHHLSLNLRPNDAYEWVEFCKWIETLGPTCMSGWLRERTAMYNYSDLTRRLGHVVESGIRRAGGGEPDFWHEFAIAPQR